MNRSSRDIALIDEYLPSVICDLAQIFFSLIGYLLVVAIINPLSIVPAFILLLSFYYMRNFYLNTSRMVKRIEATSE